MRTHVFEVNGPLALFKKPYSPASPVSYPFPPIPTVTGMIGAICGYGKNEYIEKVGWDRVKIGIELRKPVTRLRAGINLLNTKEGAFYNAEGGRIQIPHEFLKDACYRIYVAQGNERMMEDLGHHLNAGTNTYTVSLGLAQCLAFIRYIDTIEGEKLPEDEYGVASVIPQDEQTKIRYDRGSKNSKYGHYRVPAKMNPERKVEEYRIVVVEENGDTTYVTSPHVWRIGDENVLFL